MNAPVDVLRVMDAAEAVMLTEHTFSRAIEMRQARAAVAELVEAAAGVLQWEDVSQLDHEWPEVVAELRAALAKFRIVR